MRGAAERPAWQRRAERVAHRARLDRLDPTGRQVAQRPQVLAPVTRPPDCDAAVQADCGAVDSRSHPAHGDRAWSRKAPALERTAKRVSRMLKRGAVQTERLLTTWGEQLLRKDLMQTPESNRAMHRPWASSDLWQPRIRDLLRVMWRGDRFALYVMLKDRPDVDL